MINKKEELDTVFVTAGALSRQGFRRFLLKKELEFTEDKGWIDSYFVIKNVTKEERDAIKSFEY